MSVRSVKQSWKDRLKAQWYSWKHSLRRRMSPVHKLRVKGETLFLSKLMPSDLELAELLMDGCTVIPTESFPAARDIGFQIVDPSMDNISTLRGVPLFVGPRCGFEAILYLVSKKIKPVRAVKIVQKFVNISLTEMDARIITLHANMSKKSEEEFCIGDA